MEILQAVPIARAIISPECSSKSKCWTKPRTALLPTAVAAMPIRRRNSLRASRMSTRSLPQHRPGETLQHKLACIVRCARGAEGATPFVLWVFGRKELFHKPNHLEEVPTWRHRTSCQRKTLSRLG